MKQMNFAERLREWRGVLKQEDAARALGVNLHTYRNWEYDRHKPRGLALAVVLGRLAGWVPTRPHAPGSVVD